MLTRVFFNDDLESWKGDTGGQWWTPYCDVALTNGLVEGTAVGTSHQQSGGWTAQIDQSVSRYDMAQMMYNLLSDKGLLGKITGSQQRKKPHFGLELGPRPVSDRRSHLLCGRAALRAMSMVRLTVRAP